MVSNRNVFSLGLLWLDWPQCGTSGMGALVQMQPKNSQGWSHLRAFGAAAPWRPLHACACVRTSLPGNLGLSRASLARGVSPSGAPTWLGFLTTWWSRGSLALSMAATSKGLKVEAAGPGKECGSVSVTATIFYQSEH